MTKARACKVCSHLERALIDRALLEFGQSPRSVKRRYVGISRRGLQRHRDVCLKEHLKAQPASLEDAA